MEAHSSRGASLRPRRKPFADLTNASSLRLSTAADSVKPRPKPKVSPEYSSTKSSVSSAGSSDPKNTGDRESPKSTFVAKGTSSISVSGVFSRIKCGFVGGESGGQDSVKLQYIIEKRKEQNDISLITSSCPPPGRTPRIRKNSLRKHGMNQNEACSEPCQKKKKRKRCLGSSGRSLIDKEDAPLQDFIQKQRAYFAEVDSFELPEEVVSEGELE